MNESLAGVRDWWERARGLLRTEADKVRAFVSAVQEFRRERQELAAARLELELLGERLEELGAPPGFERRRRLLEGELRVVELKGGRLELDVTQLLARTHAEHENVDAAGRDGYAGVAELGGVFLVLGIGAGAVLLTGWLVAWILSAQAVREGIGQFRRCVDLVETGNLSSAECAELLRAGTPRLEVLGGKAAGVIVAAVAAALLYRRRG